MSLIPTAPLSYLIYLPLPLFALRLPSHWRGTHAEAVLPACAAPPHCAVLPYCAPVPRDLYQASGSLSHTPHLPEPNTVPARSGRMRIVIAECPVDYEGRLRAHLPALPAC